MKKLSCGFILQDIKTNKYLGCVPTGRSNGECDIPKGGMEEGETYLECAMRELKEETGIDRVEDIRVLGLTPYNKYKDLYLFHAFADIDIDKLHCDSKFEYLGRMIPEMSSYKLGDIDIYTKNMNKAIKNALKIEK